MEFSNIDKDFYNTDENKSSIFPRGSAMLSVGVKSSGKTFRTFQIIKNCVPEFDICYIVKDKSTNEYDMIPHINVDSINKLPEIESLDKNKKILIIIEDLGRSTIKKQDNEYMDKLLRIYVSHHGLCVIMNAQSANDINYSYRKKIFYYNLFLKNLDISKLLIYIPLKRKTKQKIREFLEDYDERDHDYLTINSYDINPISLNDKKLF